MPPVAKRAATVDSTTLIDLPPYYLLERGDWPEFKRAMNTCGLTWSLPDWMTTIVQHGTQWKEMEGEHKLNEVFPPATRRIGEVADAKVSDASANLVKALGFPARQKFWVWILQSLRGPKTTVGQYYYLTQQGSALERQCADLTTSMPDFLRLAVLLFRSHTSGAV